jgi:hypothetical protein
MLPYSGVKRPSSCKKRPITVYPKLLQLKLRIFTKVMKLLVLCTENQFFLIEVLDALGLLIDKKVIFSEKNLYRPHR